MIKRWRSATSVATQRRIGRRDEPVAAAKLSRYFDMNGNVVCSNGRMSNSKMSNVDDALLFVSKQRRRKCRDEEVRRSVRFTWLRFGFGNGRRSRLFLRRLFVFLGGIFFVLVVVVRRRNRSSKPQLLLQTRRRSIRFTSFRRFSSISFSSAIFSFCSSRRSNRSADKIRTVRDRFPRRAENVLRCRSIVPGGCE